MLIMAYAFYDVYPALGFPGKAACAVIAGSRKEARWEGVEVGSRKSEVGSQQSAVRSRRSEGQGLTRSSTNFFDISPCCTTGVSISLRALRRHLPTSDLRLLTSDVWKEPIPAGWVRFLIRFQIGAAKK